MSKQMCAVVLSNKGAKNKKRRILIPLACITAVRVWPSHGVLTKFPKSETSPGNTKSVKKDATSFTFFSFFNIKVQKVENEGEI